MFEIFALNTLLRVHEMSCTGVKCSQQDKNYYMLLFSLGQNMRKEQGEWERLNPLISSYEILYIYIWLLLPSQFFSSCFCPFQIKEKVLALTPTLSEMKEEITVLICAYFGSFETSSLKLYTSHHASLNYSSTCETFLESKICSGKMNWKRNTRAAPTG